MIWDRFACELTEFYRFFGLSWEVPTENPLDRGAIWEDYLREQGGILTPPLRASRECIPPMLRGAMGRANLQQ